MDEICTRYFHVERCEVAYLKFILEGYDGLALLTTVDREEAIVKLASPSGLAPELDLLLAALSREIMMTEVPASGLPRTRNGGTCHA